MQFCGEGHLRLFLIVQADASSGPRRGGDADGESGDAGGAPQTSFTAGLAVMGDSAE